MRPEEMRPEEPMALMELDLTGNEITDKGALALSFVLQSNPKLNGLVLAHNKITDEGALALLSSIAYTTEPEATEKQRGQPKKDTGPILQQHNTELKELTITGNLLSEQMKLLMQETLLERDDLILQVLDAPLF